MESVTRAWVCQLARVAVIVVGCASWGRPLAGQSARPSDYDVKAAYLFNFGRFVLWPKGPASEPGPFTVCVLGQDPFGQALDTTLANERIDGRPAIPRRISKPEEAAACRIVFVSSSEERDWPRLLTVMERRGLVTVSDMPKFVERGGMIQFVSKDNRVRFEVNLAAAERASVTLSSDLLKVATAVHRTPRPGA